jgi:hypothetical protein
MRSARAALRPRQGLEESSARQWRKALVTYETRIAESSPLGFPAAKNAVRGDVPEIWSTAMLRQEAPDFMMTIPDIYRGPERHKRCLRRGCRGAKPKTPHCLIA